MSISSGFPENEYAGFAKGKVEPSVSSLTFYGSVRDLEFSIQVKFCFRVFVPVVVSESHKSKKFFCIF